MAVKPSWLRLLLTGLVTAICTGGLVAALCVWLLTPRPEVPAAGPALPPPVLPPQLASDEGQGEAGAGAAPRLTEPGPSASLLGRFPHAAVAVDSVPCAAIGRDILAREGTAVDAAIATLFCNGVVNPQSMGLGGGFLMTVYLANGTAVSLVARETAPAAASRDMYSGERSSRVGPGAAGVPGELLGYWEAKQRLGNPALPWTDLLHPTIDLCEQGITVSAAVVRSLVYSEAAIRADPGLKELLVDPATDQLLTEGAVYRNPALAATLRRFAAGGAAELYTGETGRRLVEDMAAGGGLLTREDLAQYRVRWEAPVSAEVPGTGHTLHSAPPPGSGAVLAAILGTAGGYSPRPRDRRAPRTWHRLIEACKFAYARRTLLGDWGHEGSGELAGRVRTLVANLTSPAWWEETRGKISDLKTQSNASFYGAEFYNVEDAGTAHISVLGPAGDAVAVTSTVNLYFGSKFRSPSTGIIMNNEMDDFSYPGIVNAFGVPPSGNNMVAPGKRPVSSMSPTVVVDGQGRVAAVVGAAGGTKITTAVAQVLYRLLYLGQDVKEAVDARRLHHQLYPDQVLWEEGSTRWLVEGLQALGHHTKAFPVGGSVVQALLVDPVSGDVTANADFRKGGGVAGF